MDVNAGLAGYYMGYWGKWVWTVIFGSDRVRWGVCEPPLSVSGLRNKWSVIDKTYIGVGLC